MLTPSATMKVAAARLMVTWWVPSFGGQWAQTDLTAAYLDGEARPIDATTPADLVNQILVSVTNMAVCEALVFAKQNGLDPAKTISAVAGALLLKDTGRLRQLLEDTKRPIQFVFAGKAHPADHEGKELIKSIVNFARDPAVRRRIVFLENYDINIARYLVQGVDVWLNTPRRGMEASGTSGMKAALNGVPSLSVLDGWWVEGCLEGATGWAIGDDAKLPQDPARDIPDLYLKLERTIMPLFPPIPMKAKVFVAVFGALELLLGVMDPRSGVAHFAHLGGMVGGFLMLQYWRGRAPFGRR